MVGAGQAILQRVDLRLQRDDFDLLAVGRAGALVELAHQLGEFGFLAARTRSASSMALVLTENSSSRGAQLVAQRLVARFQRENGGGLFAELDLEPVDGVVLLAEFGKLAGALGA